MTTVFLDPRSRPGDYPSPALLAAAAALRARGEIVAFHCIALDDVPRTIARIAPGTRVVIAAPPPGRDAANALRSAVVGLGVANEAVALFDPWAQATGRAVDADGFALVAGQTDCLAEIDVVPSHDPVHPWVCAATNAPAGAGTEAWLQAAVTSFATAAPAVRQRPALPVRERELFLNDPRAPVDLDRLRTLARAAQWALRQHTMLKLHLRVWPSAIDRRLVDNLSLLPIGSLELLAGSCDGAAGARPGASSREVVEQALAALRDGGMSHVTSISLVVALPGQTPEDAVGSIRRAIALAAAARVRRIRFAFWLGEGAPCPDSEAQQHALFLASHPDWHPVEYAGVSDFVSLMRRFVPGTAIIGPEIVPGWGPPSTEERMAGVDTCTAY